MDGLITLARVRIVYHILRATIAALHVAQQSILSCLFRIGKRDYLEDESSVTAETAFSEEVYSLYVYSTPLCGGPYCMTVE